jgi:hypothetical protein
MSRVKRRQLAQTASPLSEEQRAVEALTAVWIIVVVNTLLCLLVALGLRQYGAAHPESVQVKVLSGVLHLTATVVGVVTLVMTPIVLWLRRVPPPLGVTVLAVLVGLAPLASLIALRLMN